jgi:3-phosphoshikimate 1-carboxyvinyltransferase
MPASLTVHPFDPSVRGPLRGTIRVPGDKSISHRAAIMAAVADGETRIHGFLDAADTRATLDVLRALGVVIDHEGDRVTVHGVGLHGLQAPAAPLDFGNSGTAMRLLSGLLAGQTFESVLVGDASLSRRPMARVAVPLRRMGAEVELAEGDTPPIRVRGTRPLRGGNFMVHSAQVEGAILLAGLYADGGVTVSHETGAMLRDHTRVLLRRFGVTAKQGCRPMPVIPPERLVSPGRLDIPADFSSAAFHLVLAALHPGSEIVLPGVGTDHARIAMLRLIDAAGLSVTEQGEEGAASMTLIARASAMHGAQLDGPDVAAAMDEFPIMAVALSQATGASRISGAAELRVKESDRIAGMVAGLGALGITAEELEDGLSLEGGRLRGGRVDAQDDHRLAMAFAVAGTVADGPVTIDGCGNIGTSYPGFVDDLRSLGVRIEEHN